MRKPASVLSKVAVALDSSRFGAWPSSASACESAIETQLACAAAISTSGLTPSASSARADHVMLSSESASLSVETVPEPLIRSPNHVARAFFSFAMLVRLLLAGTRRSIVRPAFQRLREVVDLEAALILVRIDVALPAAELFRTVVVRVAELVGRARV